MDDKIKNNKPKHLKIWSAGCSTGEEPYTLAMMMLEKTRAQAGWTIEIIANDISDAVLQKARVGEYTGLTLRNVSPTILERYFVKSGELYKVKPEVKALVKFSHMNLNDPRKPFVTTGMDTIFCRNVMIYFSDEIKKSLVRGFYNTLQPGGYFYIGHSETLHGISKAFKLVYFKNALVYQKEASETASRTGTTASTGASTAASSGAMRAMELLNNIKPIMVKK
jgi:chemotaxis protein methyltransferase CheR